MKDCRDVIACSLIATTDKLSFYSQLSVEKHKQNVLHKITEESNSILCKLSQKGNMENCLI